MKFITYLYVALWQLCLFIFHRCGFVRTIPTSPMCLYTPMSSTSAHLSYLNLSDHPVNDHSINCRWTKPKLNTHGLRSLRQYCIKNGYSTTADSTTYEKDYFSKPSLRNTLASYINKCHFRSFMLTMSRSCIDFYGLRGIWFKPSHCGVIVHIVLFGLWVLQTKDK